MGGVGVEVRRVAGGGGVDDRSEHAAGDDRWRSVNWLAPLPDSLPLAIPFIVLQVIIIDRPTGREREQSIWQQGLHQVRSRSPTRLPAGLRHSTAWASVFSVPCLLPSHTLTFVCVYSCLKAIQAKHGLPITPENHTAATISYQSLFSYYAKLAGMTVRRRRQSCAR